MSFLKKIREKPEKKRKKILWISIFFIAIFLIIVWILQLKFTLSNISFENISLPTIDTKEFKEAQKNFKELEEKFKELEVTPTPTTSLDSLIFSPTTSP